MAQDIEYKKRTPYCTHCYVNGAFTNGEISMRDMMKQMEERAKVLGVPWLTRQIWKLDLYKLERWRRSFTWK
ncbi:MAG: hypothetical protein JNL05_14195 [Flavobacteriales bacterium]|nr:hypothetical protein [Flavobacteriales bacterium]